MRKGMRGGRGGWAVRKEIWIGRGGGNCEKRDVGMGRREL